MREKVILQVSQLSYKINKVPILRQVSLQVKEGEFVGIIGPNGSGKSTLLKNIYKIATPDEGSIFLKGKALLPMSNKQMAQEMAVVAQENAANFDFTVLEVVQMGRYPRKKLLEAPNKEDLDIVMEALKEVDMSMFANRSFLSLSGGEKQRVLIARALSQQTEVIVLDEPTNHLDIGSQIKTLELMKKSGKTILTALHDLSLAAKFCDRLYVMHNGSIISEGRPEEVISSKLIKDIYHIDAEVFERKGKIYIDYH